MDYFKIICYNSDMLKTICMEKIPKIWFAHIFSATKYHGVVDLMPNSLEITYLKKGNLTYYDIDDNKFELKEGTVFIGAYNSIRRVQSEAFHEHHTFSFIFTPAANDSEGLSFSYLPVLSDETVCQNIAKYMDLLIMEYKIGGSYDIKTISYFFKILEIIDDYSKSVSEDNLYGNMRYVNRAKKYIAEHVDKKITIDDIAYAVNLTPQYLCNIFKTVTGITIITYVNRLKLEKIRNLVINNGLTLRQAGESVGFNDENYISRIFKKYYGKSISELKKYPDRMLKYIPIGKQK